MVTLKGIIKLANHVLNILDIKKESIVARPIHVYQTKYLE